MFSSDKDTGTLWRAGEMGYGRNPIVIAKMMAERPPGKPEEGGYAYFLGPDQELIEAGGGPGQEDMFHHVHFLHEEPWCAAQWYVDHLGFKRQQRQEPGDERSDGSADPAAVRRARRTSELAVNDAAGHAAESAGDGRVSSTTASLGTPVLVSRAAAAKAMSN